MLFATRGSPVKYASSSLGPRLARALAASCEPASTSDVLASNPASLAPASTSFVPPVPFGPASLVAGPRPQAPSRSTSATALPCGRTLDERLDSRPDELRLLDRRDVGPRREHEQ